MMHLKKLHPRLYLDLSKSSSKKFVRNFFISVVYIFKMGNEESVAEIPATNKSMQQNAAPKQSPDHELLIVVRGTRRTGKTCLISMMQGAQFNEEYNATPQISASEVMWKSSDNENINITIWDVVERGLLPVDTYEKKESADSTTVDTLTRADGLIIVIDKRFKDTYELAEKIIRETNPYLPILVFSNFIDESVDPVIPVNLQNLMGRFYFVPGSLKRNQGLNKILEWLQVPLIASKKRMFYNLYKKYEEDLMMKNVEFTATAEHFVLLETAKDFVPEPMKTVQYQQIPKIDQEHVTQQKQTNDQNIQEIQENDLTKYEKPLITTRNVTINQNDHGNIPKPNNIETQNKQEIAPRKYEKPYQRRKIQRTHVTQKSVNENKQKVVVKVRKQHTKQEEKDFFDSDDNEPKIENINSLQKDDDDEIIKPNPLVKPKVNMQKKITKSIIRENEVNEPKEISEQNNNISNKKDMKEDEKGNLKPNISITTKQNVLEEQNQNKEKENKEEEEFNDDFWGDDDDNDEPQSPNEKENDSEDESFKPNPFVVKGAHSNLYRSIQAQENKENLEEKKMLPKPINVNFEQENIQNEIPQENQPDENEYMSI